MPDESRAEEARRQRAREYAQGLSRCRTCAGSDLPGYLDQTDPDQQGIHDWVPCPACNPKHPLHTRNSMTRIGNGPGQVVGKIPMSVDFKAEARRMIDEGRVRAAKLRDEDLRRKR